MSRIRSKNTKPELMVRSLLHRMGYRFRLHVKNLPGSPDIVLPKYKTVIFVNGCFWHRHKNCKRCTMPSSNREYWEKRFKRNLEKDILHEQVLNEQGWHVITLWECEIRDKVKLEKFLDQELTEKSI